MDVDNASTYSNSKTDSVSLATNLKHKILLAAHSLSSILHIGILYFLLIEWSKVSNPVLTHFQIVCLVIIGAGLVIIIGLVFIILRYELRIASHAKRFFHVWPLVHIGMSTVYQLVTQVFVSHHGSYELPSLYTAWATTVSVAIHLILHSVSVFW